MPLLQTPASRVPATLFLALAAGACAQSSPEVTASVEPQAAGCLAAGDGNLQAELRGALVADLAWQNGQMQCEGGMRPDGTGIRITIAGPLPAQAVQPPAAAGAAPGHLRFIFGIDPHDTANGVAQALPTNLTVIVEGGKQLYATLGDDKCAVETLRRTPLPGGGKVDRVQVRGYCTGPASDLAGTVRLFVPTFSFTALLRTGDDP